MSKIIVTGAAGFIGWRLADALSRDDSNLVHCVDNFIRGDDDEAYRELCARPNVFRHDLDLTKLESVDELPDEVDVIYHMAALNGTQNFYERSFDVMKCCTLPTIYLLDRYGRSSLQRFMYAGTSEAYASTVTRFGWEVPTDETVPLSIDDPSNVRWSYGGSKLHGEIAVQCAARQLNLPFSIIRYHNVYGPRMGDKHVAPDFLMRARRGELSLHGYEDTRAFLYIDDAVDATIAVAMSKNCEGETINIGSENEMIIKDFAELMMDVAGLKGEIALHPSPQGSVKRRAPNTKKLRELTGFSEKWSLRDGLRETVAFYLSEDPAQA